MDTMHDRLAARLRRRETFALAFAAAALIASFAIALH
jgi:hypothetical protein